MNIKNIVSVRRCLCESVVPNGSCASYSVVAPEGGWEKLDIIVPARLELSEKDEDKNRRYSAKLTFTTRNVLDEHERRWAYRCTCADGSIYIIGDKSRPFPVTTRTHNLSENPNDSSLPKYAVEFSDMKPIPYLNRG